MNRTEYIGKLNALYVGDKNCLEELIIAYDEKDKEIERLNNIINELEKYLIAEIEDYDKSINSKFITDISKEQYEGEKVCFEDMLGRLQELKGDGSNDS